MSFQVISETAMFGGIVGYYSHKSHACNCDMRFSVFTPEQASSEKVPVVTWLSGLTCTEENFTIKAGAYRAASALGLMIVAPDTSPRGDDVPDERTYDFGQGAGFYLDATVVPWRTHFNMYSYITRDLPEVLFSNFSGDHTRQGIMGHSMGGHGALTIWLKNQNTYKSVSAFAPICAPMECTWGQNAFGKYLGDDKIAWENYDACKLMQSSGDGSDRQEILVDQGLADDFIETQLHPHQLEDACAKVSQNLNLRRHTGYDHSFFFISTFIDDHLNHHHKALHHQD